MSCSTVLKKKGYKLTPQRKVILDIIHHADAHLTADDIYLKVKERVLGVNRSTVYRTLELLASLKLVVRSELGPSHVYHHSEEGHHHHLVCRNCGGVVDCEDDILVSLKGKLIKEYGFTADLHHHVIQGVCKSCLGK